MKKVKGYLTNTLLVVGFLFIGYFCFSFGVKSFDEVEKYVHTKGQFSATIIFYANNELIMYAKKGDDMVMIPDAYSFTSKLEAVSGLVSAWNRINNIYLTTIVPLGNKIDQDVIEFELPTKFNDSEMILDGVIYNKSTLGEFDRSLVEFYSEYEED